MITLFKIKRYNEKLSNEKVFFRIFLLLVLVFVCEEINGQTLLGNYTFTGLSTSTGPASRLLASNVASNVSFSTYNKNILTINAQSSIDDNVFSVKPSTGDFGSVINTNMYEEFSVTPNSGYYLNLSSITFRISRTTSGATSFSIRSSVDSFVSDLSTGTISTTYVTKTIPLTGNSFSAVTYRIYFYGASSTGFVRIDDVAFNGSISCTPPQNVSVTPSTATVCEGTITALTTSGGTSITNTTNIIGTSNNVISPLSYGPNPLNSWYGGTKVQMIYTAAELTAIGLVNGGTISSVGLYVNNFVSSDCTDLTIRMKNTNSTVLTGFETGTSDVYGPLTFTPSAAGWVNFSLATIFVWTGENIIVEFVHNSNNTGNGDGTYTRYTSTSENSTYYTMKDDAGVGISGFDSTSLTTGTFFSSVSKKRPNIQFGFPTVTTNPITWTPVSGLYTNSSATSAYTTGTNTTTLYAKPTITKIYTATAKTTSGCSTTGSCTITVNPNPSTTLIYHQ